MSASKNAPHTYMRVKGSAAHLECSRMSSNTGAHTIRASKNAPHTYTCIKGSAVPLGRKRVSCPSSKQVSCPFIRVEEHPAYMLVMSSDDVFQEASTRYRAVERSSGSNVIPRRARPGLAGLRPHRTPRWSWVDFHPQSGHGLTFRMKVDGCPLRAKSVKPSGPFHAIPP